MKRTALPHVLLVAAVTGVALAASAQPRFRAPNPVASAAPVASAPTNVRAHVGTDYATRLLKSVDADDRIRGIQRLALIGTPEAISLLATAMETTQGVRSDPRALVEMARALSRFTDNERARSALVLILNTGNPGLGGRIPSTTKTLESLQIDEGDPVARTELARDIAAIALARSGYDKSLEQLYGMARGGGGAQSAALRALLLQPPRDVSIFGSTPTTMPIPVIRMLGRLGDLRVLDLLNGASKSTDVAVRAAALLSLAELGDGRAVATAKTAIAESDARLRGAAAEALVVLGAPERFKAVAALIGDDATAMSGIRLAERVYHVEITKLLATKALESPDRELRLAAVQALGRSPDANAAAALASPKLLGDVSMQYPALHALSRSPAPNATSLVSAVAAGNLRGIGARAYLVRALAKNERTAQGDGVLNALAASKEPKDRALALFAHVALGDVNAAEHLNDTDARMRIAAAMGVHAKHASMDKRLLTQLSKETDASARQALAIGLEKGDPDEVLTTTWLLDHAEGGAGDAGLAAFAYARRADEPVARKIALLLGSKDPLIRAHTARGLADAPMADASGRLAEAYLYETDVDVRRAIVTALAGRTKDANAPSRKGTLEMAAQLDPDGPTRQAARRALDGSTMPFGAPQTTEVAWLRLSSDAGGSPNESFGGSIVRSDGIAEPIAFDEDGYAIVMGLPAGESRLVLAPRLPTYKAPAP